MKRYILFLFAISIIQNTNALEVTINGLNYFLYLQSHEATITYGHTCSGELDIPSEISYNDETFVVKSMFVHSFYNNTELTKVRIPKTIENILHSYPYDSDDEDPPTGMVSPDHMNPFRECTALEAIEVDEENPSLKSVDGVLFSQDGRGYYYYQTNSYYGTGLYCYPAGARRESYTIPNGVEWIGSGAFDHNQYISTLTIPSSMKMMYYSVFAGCSNLKDIYCNAENVPVAFDYAFKDFPIASATLHVPAGSVEAYKATSPWSGFGNIVAIEEPYQPLPLLEGNPIWVYKYEHIPTLRDPYIKCWLDTGDRSFTYYFLCGQKEIDGKLYKMMGEVRCDRDGKITLSRWLPVREENDIVYAITDSLPGVVETEDNYDARYNDDNPMPYLRLGNECVLYNFSTDIGETLYPQNEGSTVKSIDTYQLLDGTECRVLKTQWAFYDLYEKLGLLNADPDFGIMDPFIGWPVSLNGHIYLNILNAYYQDNIMLYKAPDARDGLCVNDTCWTRDDAEAYARSYKADPHQEEVFSYIRQLQKASIYNDETAEEYFPEGTRWTEIRLDTLLYNSWYSKVGDSWVPNFETIEYHVEGDYTEKWGDTYKCVFSNAPEWMGTPLLIKETSSDFSVSLIYDEESKGVMSPATVYQFDWNVGKGLYYNDLLDANSTGIVPYYFFYGVIDEIKEGYFGGVRPLKYVDLDGKAATLEFGYCIDTKGGRIIQGIGITEWNDGECLFGPPNPYFAMTGSYNDRHYRSMLVHFERDGEVLYDVWPEKEATTEVTFTEGQMATIVLPTEPDASKGKYYRLDRVEGKKIIFERELQPRAHVPYIIVPSEDFCIDLSTLDLAGLNNDTVSTEGVSFIGTYDRKELNEQEGFYIDIIDTTPDCSLSNDKQMIGALRAYLLVTWDDPYNHGGTKVPTDRMEIVLHNNTTGIKTLSNSPLKEENIYDLNGIIVNSKSSNRKLPHGIYIKDGRKEVIR